MELFNLTQFFLNNKSFAKAEKVLISKLKAKVNLNPKRDSI